MVEKYQITKKDEVFNLLKKKPNFALMSADLLKKLIETMKVSRYKKGDIVMKQAETVDKFYIIIKGSASISVDGKYIYSLKETGDVIGEIGFLTGSESSAAVMAENELGLVEISYGFLSKLNSIEFGLWLCRILGEKLIRTLNIKRSKNGNNSKEGETNSPEKAETNQEGAVSSAKPYKITRKQEVFEILKEKRNFNEMSETLLKQLLDNMKVYRYEKNQIIYKEGSTVDNFHIIIKGGVAQYMNNKHLFDLKRTGDVFGVVNFATKLESQTTIFADSDLGVGEISYGLFEKVKNVEACLWLGRILARKVVRASKLKQEKEAEKTNGQNNGQNSAQDDNEDPQSAPQNE